MCLGSSKLGRGPWKQQGPTLGLLCMYFPTVEENHNNMTL